MTYAVRTRVADPYGWVNLRANAKALPSLEAALGFALPSAPNTTSHTDDLIAFWLGPDEWLLRTPDAAEEAWTAALREAVGSHHSAVTVVSDGYVSFEIAGQDAREILEQGTGIDIHPTVFKPGQCARVRFAKTLALIHPIDVPPGYHIHVARSYGRYVALWLERARGA